MFARPAPYYYTSRTLIWTYMQISAQTPFKVNETVPLKRSRAMFLDQDDADDAVHHKPKKKSKKPTIYNIQTLPTSVHTVPQMNSGRFN